MSQLEQTCPACGRSEVADTTCTWCGQKMRPEDQYAPGKFPASYQAARLPLTAPADPPPEFRKARDWPAIWGPFPFLKNGRRKGLGAQGALNRR